MQNWHAIETETAFRRQEWERIAAADARAALANPASRRGRLPRLLMPDLPWDKLTLFRVLIAVRNLARRNPGCTATTGD